MELSRRMLICTAAAFSVSPLPAARREEVHRFRTAEFEVGMTIEFHDGYASKGFWFREEGANRHFCLSAEGKDGSNCLTTFRGSVAIARYTVRTGKRHDAAVMLREHVRTIDRDSRLDVRPPFERVIQLEKGVGSDLQAFGYEPLPGEKLTPDNHGPWYLFRQDLFLTPQTNPFLVVYWKHALSFIRVLDLIPGEQTWEIK